MGSKRTSIETDLKNFSKLLIKHNINKNEITFEGADLAATIRGLLLKFEQADKKQHYYGQKCFLEDMLGEIEQLQNGDAHNARQVPATYNYQIIRKDSSLTLAHTEQNQKGSERLLDSLCCKVFGLNPTTLAKLELQVNKEKKESPAPRPLQY